MALSASSLGVFVFLLPGLVLRYFIYQGSLVKRAILSANPIFAALSVLLFALSVHVAAAAGGWLGLAALCRVQVVCSELHQVYGAGPALKGGAGSERLLELLVAHPWALMAYLGYAIVVAYGLAKLFALAARVNGSAARLLYGPLASLAHAGQIEMITCFVLTNIGHENRQIIYSGFPEEIGLKDGSKIDYLVLRAPEKFYLRKNRRRPQTSLAQARKISQPYARGFLFIAGGQIENVHFESWSF